MNNLCMQPILLKDVSVNVRDKRLLFCVQTIFILSFLILITFSTISLADSKTRSGQFSGLSNHTTTGSVSVMKTGEGYVIKLEQDFRLDGAPDPKVALGNDGHYDPATLLELLESNTGEQTYAVPESIDPTAYNEVYIWCEKYSVGLGVARLN